MNNLNIGAIFPKLEEKNSFVLSDSVNISEYYLHMLRRNLIAFRRVFTIYIAYL